MTAKQPRRPRQIHHMQGSETTPCPFCGHERNLRITGCVVCAHHTLAIGSKDGLSALLIDDLAALAQTPAQRRRKRMEVA